jgi:hypothetical protein
MCLHLLLLALGIAGCSAGDSLGPVLGAVAFDKGGGLQAAFLLQPAVNAVPLLLALLLIPLWAHNTRNTPAVTTAPGFASSSSGRGDSSSECTDSYAEGDDLRRRLSCDLALSCDQITLPAGPELSKAELDLMWDFSKVRQSCSDREVRRSSLSRVHGTHCAATSVRRRPQSMEVSRCQKATDKSSAAAAAAAAAALTATYTDLSLDSDTDVHKDSSAIRHLDSAFDLECGRHTGTAAHQVKGADSDLSDYSTQQQQQQQPEQTLDSDHDHSSKLDLRSVQRPVSDAVVASQCLLVLLEQAATGAVVVLLPVMMGLATWLVGVLFFAMVRAVVNPVSVAVVL